MTQFDPKGFGGPHDPPPSPFGPRPHVPSVAAPPPLATSPFRENAQPPAKPASIVGLALSMVWLAAGVVGCVATAGAAAFSESNGVLASYVAIPLFAGGFCALLTAPWVRRREPEWAVGAPVGVGCLGMLLAALGLLVFYLVVWPAL